MLRRVDVDDLRVRRRGRRGGVASLGGPARGPEVGVPVAVLGTEADGGPGPRGLRSCCTRCGPVGIALGKADPCQAFWDVSLVIGKHQSIGSPDAPGAPHLTDPAPGDLTDANGTLAVCVRPPVPRPGRLRRRKWGWHRRRLGRGPLPEPVQALRGHLRRPAHRRGELRHLRNRLRRGPGLRGRPVRHHLRPGPRPLHRQRRDRLLRRHGGGPGELRDLRQRLHRPDQRRRRLRRGHLRLRLRRRLRRLQLRCLRRLRDRRGQRPGQLRGLWPRLPGRAGGGRHLHPGGLWHRLRPGPRRLQQRPRRRLRGGPRRRSGELRDLWQHL